MPAPLRSAMSSRRLKPGRLVVAGVGLGLFAYTIHTAGALAIVDGVRHVSWGFLLIVFLGGFRMAARALAWTLCVEGPVRMRFGDAFPAILIGEAIGNLTPLSLIVSEPTKALVVRDRVPLMTGFSALAIEAIFYSLSAALMIVAGTALLIFSFAMPEALRLASLSMLVLMAAGVVGVLWVIRRQWKLTSIIAAWLSDRGVASRTIRPHLERLRTLEGRIYEFYAQRPVQLVPLLGLEALYHASGVAEVWVTLAFMGGGFAPTLLTAFILESVNRAINVIFKFVPLRLGVDEAGTGLLTQVLGHGTASGVTLAIIRKARVLVWTGVGVALLIGRGLSVGSTVDEAIATNQQLRG